MRGNDLTNLVNKYDTMLNWVMVIMSLISLSVLVYYGNFDTSDVVSSFLFGSGFGIGVLCILRRFFGGK